MRSLTTVEKSFEYTGSWRKSCDCIGSMLIFYKRVNIYRTVFRAGLFDGRFYLFCIFFFFFYVIGRRGSGRDDGKTKTRDSQSFVNLYTNSYRDYISRVYEYRAVLDGSTRSRPFYYRRRLRYRLERIMPGAPVVLVGARSRFSNKNPQNRFAITHCPQCVCVRVCELIHV